MKTLLDKKSFEVNKILENIKQKKLKDFIKDGLVNTISFNEKFKIFLKNLSDIDEIIFSNFNPQVK